MKWPAHQANVYQEADPLEGKQKCGPCHVTVPLSAVESCLEQKESASDQYMPILPKSSTEDNLGRSTKSEILFLVSLYVCTVLCVCVCVCVCV